MDPSWSKDGPKLVQDEPKLSQDEPKMVQVEPKLDPRGTWTGSGAVCIGFYTVSEAPVQVAKSGFLFRVGRGYKAVYIYIRSRDSGAQAGSPVVQGKHLRDSGYMREAMWAQDGRREAQVEPR